MPLFGWDMSHYDASSVGTAVAEGISFITHKAGGDVDDPELGAWWAGVKSQNVLLGAYWVLYPGNPVSRADSFLARLDSQCPRWRDRPFILQVDCEKWNNSPSTVPGKADIKAFCDRLVEKMPKLNPIVYAPKWVYGDSLLGLGYPLWASSYVSGSGSFKSLYPGDNASSWGFYSGQSPAILQYTSSATIGGQTTCDANAYRGTLADLIKLVAPGWSDEMTPDDRTWIAAQIAAVTAMDAPQSDGTPTSKVGRAAWNQGIPNGLDPAKARETAWQVLKDLGVAVAELSAKVDALSNTTNPAPTSPEDPDVIANKVLDLLVQRLSS